MSVLEIVGAVVLVLFGTLVVAHVYRTVSQHLYPWAYVRCPVCKTAMSWRRGDPFVTVCRVASDAAPAAPGVVEERREGP